MVEECLVSNPVASAPANMKPGDIIPMNHTTHTDVILGMHLQKCQYVLI